MFFARIGLVLAYLGLMLGAYQVAMGLFLALSTETMAANVAAAQRYIGTTNSGEAIDQGGLYILVSVLLGALCEMSKRR